MRFMASAQLNYTRLDHNLWINGTKGMVIHVGFDVHGLAGQSGRVAAYFNYWQGVPLRDFNGIYKAEDGHVSVGEDFNADFDATNYKDIQLFMPYDELHMVPGGSAALMCKVIVWDKSHNVPQELANSAWMPFNYSSFRKPSFSNRREDEADEDDDERQREEEEQRRQADEDEDERRRNDPSDPNWDGTDW
jgi:hypothetical protein